MHWTIYAYSAGYYVIRPSAFDFYNTSFLAASYDLQYFPVEVLLKAPSQLGDIS